MTSRTLSILNDPPYSTEGCHNTTWLTNAIANADTGHPTACRSTTDEFVVTTVAADKV